MSKQKLKIILLCGGKGIRLKPLTNYIPKPLIKIKNKPILGYLIDHLIDQDFKNLEFATGYKSQKIELFLTDNYPQLTYNVNDSGDVDIIKRIQNIIRDIDTDFLILYGDTISNVIVKHIITRHKNHNQPITMTVWPLTVQFGIIDITNKGIIKKFQEKPTMDKWINIGYIYFENKVKKEIFNYEKFEEFLVEMSKQRKINTYKHLGHHITVNTLRELEDAEQNISYITN